MPKAVIEAVEMIGKALEYDTAGQYRKAVKTVEKALLLFANEELRVTIEQLLPALVFLVEWHSKLGNLEGALRLSALAHAPAAAGRGHSLPSSAQL